LLRFRESQAIPFTQLVTPIHYQLVLGDSTPTKRS
jgi:hypothetical protein